MILYINIIDYFHFFNTLGTNSILFFRFLFRIHSNNLNAAIFHICHIIYIINPDLMVYYKYILFTIVRKVG